VETRYHAHSRLSDGVFDDYMPSYSSIHAPIAWVNNTICERYRKSLPDGLRQAKAGNPPGSQSNLLTTPTPRGTVPQKMGQGQSQSLWLHRQAGTRFISISGLLSDSESNGSVCP
jgi:hypothetical protein